MRSSADCVVSSNGSDLPTSPPSPGQARAYRTSSLRRIAAQSLFFLGLLSVALGHPSAWAQTATKAEIARPQASLADDISALGKKVRDAEDDIDSLEKRAKDAEGRVGTLEGNVTGVTTRVGGLETKSGSLDTGLQILGVKVDVVDGKLQAVDTKFNLLDSRFQSLGGKVDLLDGNVQTLGGEVGLLDGNVKAIDGQLKLLDSGFQAIGSKVDLVDGSLQAIESKVNALDGSFEVIDVGLKTIDGKVDGLDAVAKKIELDLQKVGKEVEDGLKKSTAIDGKIDGLDGVVQNLDGKVDGLDGVVQSLDGKVDGLDGKLGQIDTKIDAKEAARDGRLDAIDGKLDGLDGGLRSVDTKVAAIDGNVLDLGGRIDTLDSRILPFDDLPRIVQEQLGVGIDPAVKDDIVAAFNKARQAIEERRQALGSLPDFLAPDDGGTQSECHAFRGELKSFLGAFATLFGSLPRVHPDHPTLVGLDGTLGIVDVIPCQGLFFLSQAPLGISGASEWLPELVTSFQEVSSLFDPSTRCEEVVARQDRLQRAVKLTKAGSILLKVISAKLHDDNYVAKTALALVPDASETTVGLHGYASVTLEQPQEKNRFSDTFKRLGELLESVSDFGSATIDQCELAATQQAILQKLELRETVIEEAIAASEGRLRGDLVAETDRLSAQMDHLSTEMTSLSERSLERVDDHRRAFDDWTGLALQLKIEEILSRESSSPVATLQLPEESGGMLELVRDVVESTIEQMLASGSSAHNADKDLRKGDQRFAEGSFKEAYKHYAKAYRSATKADGGKDSDEDSDSG